MNDANRTFLDTQLAANTLILVNMGQVVLHRNGLLGTGLGTLHAANTASGTGLPGIAALIFVLTQDYGLALVLRHNGDHGVRAGSGTGTTAYTLFPIHLCDAVHNMNGIKGTGAGTVTITQAAKFAHSVAAIQTLYRLAALQPLKFVTLGGFSAGTGTGHNGLHGNGSTGFHTHDLGDGSSGFSATRSTFVYCVAFLHNALGIVGTASAATGAAVGTC